MDHYQLTTDDITAIVRWFNNKKRLLPWRTNTTPYRVWIAEVMLQQTQVKKVTPYYERWMDRWPTLERLAEASLEELYTFWEGLGYYKRLVNLHTCCHTILHQHNGVFPKRLIDLLALPGIGPYTAHAIQAFAFQSSAAPFDSNIWRVLARFEGIANLPHSPTDQKKIVKHWLDTLKKNRLYSASEGLMEIGALLCTAHSTKCDQCPLSKKCVAQREGLQGSIPIKKQRPERKKIEGHLVVAMHDSSIYLGKRSNGLHHLPFFLKTSPIEQCLTEAGVQFQKIEYLGVVKNSVTVHDYTWHCCFTTKTSWPNEMLYPIKGLSKLSFGSGDKQALRLAQQHFTL